MSKITVELGTSYIMDIVMLTIMPKYCEQQFNFQVKCSVFNVFNFHQYSILVRFKNFIIIFKPYVHAF